MELGEHEQNEPPVADCDCRRCAVATRDALRKDAERYRWLKAQGLLKVAVMTTAVESSRIYGDNTYRVPIKTGSLDIAIDAAINGANAGVNPRREAASD